MMLRKTINKALYSRVELTDFENDRIVGWLIPSPYNKKYMIMPIDVVNNSIQFNAGEIKSIKYLSNGYVLK